MTVKSVSKDIQRAIVELRAAVLLPEGRKAREPENQTAPAKKNDPKHHLHPRNKILALKYSMSRMLVSLKTSVSDSISHFSIIDRPSWSPSAVPSLQ